MLSNVEINVFIYDTPSQVATMEPITYCENKILQYYQLELPKNSAYQIRFARFYLKEVYKPSNPTTYVVQIYHISLD